MDQTKGGPQLMSIVQGGVGDLHRLSDGGIQTAKLYLKVGEKEIDHAIEVVGRARNDALTHTLIDYLMGETDNVPKDANYVYRLHKALGNYMQAAGTAHIIAKQEQEMGNYKQARRWKPCLKNVKSHLVSGHIDLGLCWLKTCRSCGVSRSLFSGMEQ